MQWLWKHFWFLYLRVWLIWTSSCNSSFQELNIFSECKQHISYSKSSSHFSILCSFVSVSHIFLSITTVVTWCQSAFPIAAFWPWTVNRDISCVLTVHIKSDPIQVANWAKSPENIILLHIWQFKFIHAFASWELIFNYHQKWNIETSSRIYIRLHPALLDLCVICVSFLKAVWPSIGTPKNEW